MMFPRTALALATLLAASPLGAFAQTPPAADDDLVVTAARQPQRASAAVRPVQVITAEDIRAAGAGSLTELLRSLGGVETSTNGGLGQISGVFMRGANSDHTVVLIDGVRIGSATLGTAPLEAIPLALIERVELLPGASSSLYGADAIGGVIQIFTRTAQRSPGVDLSWTAGERGLARVAGSYAARLGQTELSLGATALRSDGYNVSDPSFWGYNPDRDGSRQLGLQARVVQHLDGGQQLGLQFLRSDSKVQYDATAVADDLSRDRTQTLAAHWSGPLLPGVEHTLRLARSWDDNHLAGSSTVFTDTTQDQLSWIGRHRVAGGTLSAGLEWSRQAVDSATAYARDSRSVRSGLLGWQAAYGALSVQADLRHDANSQYGGHSTGQLGLAWQASSALRLRGALGSAFKAPTFNQLYYSDNFGSNGNPALQPERSVNAELGADLSMGGVQWSATLFSNRIRQLINWVETVPGSFSYQPRNTARARIDGLVLGASGTLPTGTRVRASLTAQSPEDSDTGAQLQRRARQFAQLHLVQPLGDWSLGSDLGYSGARWDSVDESAGTRMGGYATVALFARWRVTPEWSLEGRVDNLTDRVYQQALGYVAPGRQAQLTLRWTPLF